MASRGGAAFGQFLSGAAGAAPGAARLGANLRQLRERKASLTEELKNYKDTLNLLQKYDEDNPRIPALVEKITQASIGDFGLDRSPVPGIPQGRAPVPVPTGPTPQPGQPIISSGPLRATVRQFEGQQVAARRTDTQFKAQSQQARAIQVAGQRAQVAGEAESEQARVVGLRVAEKAATDIARAAEKAAKPGEGFRNFYKSIGSQLVKKAKELADRKGFVPEAVPGILGTGFLGNATIVENAQRSVDITQKEMDDLLREQSNIKNLAAKRGKVLEPNQWDIFQAGNPGAAQNVANSQTNPAQVTSKAQYDALQVGTWYVHPTRGVIQKTAGQAASAVNRAGV